MLVFVLLQFVLTVRFMPVQTFDSPNFGNNYHHEWDEHTNDIRVATGK
jgi:hypothetical protein